MLYTILYMGNIDTAGMTSDKVTRLTKFKYVATRDGDEYDGVLQARDRFEVYAKVRSEGGEIVSVERLGGWSTFSFSGIRAINERFSTVKKVDIIIFARNLSAMLGAGLSLTRALSVANRQTKNPRLNYVLRSLAAKVRKGDPLSSALAEHPNMFKKLFIAMVRAGEEGGNLPESLASVSLQMDKSYKLKKRIKGAMIYPAIVMIAMVLIGFLMMTQVVPTLKKTFSEVGVDLPATTKAIIAASDFLVANTLLSLALAVVFVFMVGYILRTRVGKAVFDAAILRLPAIGTIVKEVNSARFARTLSSLLGSGVDIVTALGITAKVVQNTHHQKVILSAAKVVQQGEPMSSIFGRREDLYPPLVSEMLAVGEETGKVSEMLEQVASFYETEVEQKTKDMSTIIEPFLMLFIGGAVGFFAMAMISPIYSLSDSI